MIKNILFLDDDVKRCKQFIKEVDSDAVRIHVAHTAKDAIDMLKEHTFDLISLDHDLGGETYVDSAREDCGMEVVRFMINSGKQYPFTIAHSYYDEAREAMYANLIPCVRYAFSIPFMLPPYLQTVLSIIRPM